MKKILSLLLICAFTVLLFACGTQSDAETSADSGRSETETAPVGTTSSASVETTAADAYSETTVQTDGLQTTAQTSAVLPKAIDGPKTTVTESELYDKLLGCWIGQMVGVSWCASTEFAATGRIMPRSRIPAWNPSKMIVEGFAQDDVYVEIPFLDAMTKYGYDCSPELIGKEFASTSFPLWHANGEARTNLKNGVEYPYCGSYLYNDHCGDLDFQIGCDFLGAMYPGMINEAATRAFEIGHLINYGDGVYGAVFVSAMHAAAYAADSIEQVVRNGIDVIPENTNFRNALEAVWSCYKEGKTWEETWQVLQDNEKWSSDDCPSFASSGANISATLNSAYIAIGLLYGRCDFADTIIISCLCGQDSDCNPSSAASVLGTFIGASRIPEIYSSGYKNVSTYFRNTLRTFDNAVSMNFELMKEVMKDYGLSTDAESEWQIPSSEEISTVPFEQKPDGFYVQVRLSGIYNREITVNCIARNGNIASAEIDFGDGSKTNLPTCSHVYEKAGKYTVTAKFTSDNGEVFSVSQEKTVKEIYKLGYTPICTVTAPTGRGSHDLGVICDGYDPGKGNAESIYQFTTKDGDSTRESVYIGLEFDRSATLDSVVFVDGMKLPNGGWFAECPTVEIKVNGEWKEVEISGVFPEYPDEADIVNGSSYETYEFKLASPAVCDGVRLSGKPGGSARFINVSEITPIIIAVN